MKEELKKYMRELSDDNNVPVGNSIEKNFQTL